VSIISTILGVESSGGQNVPQGITDINSQQGTPAQGYFQIINPTWAAYGGTATGYNSAIAAPYATQLQVAQNIPVNQWGPATIAQLGAQGYHPIGNETLGAMLARYGENPAATIPADGSSPTGGIMAAGDPSNASSGIAAGSGAGSTAGPAIDPATGMPATLTDAAGNAAGAGAGTGSQITVGLQKSLVGDVQGWITEIATGVWQGMVKSLGSTFLSIQNWFVRAFVIIVGLVILAIGLIKLSGHDVTTVIAKGAELAAA
jgi:hypothetical protein